MRLSQGISPVPPSAPSSLTFAPPHHCPLPRWNSSAQLTFSAALSCLKVPPALGEPVFDRLEAKLAHAMLSLPATKGFEFGSGFSGTRMRGSQHNGVRRSD